MVTKKGGTDIKDPIDPIKPPIKPPKPKPISYGYKVLKRDSGKYVSAVETGAEQKVQYGLYAKTESQAKEFGSMSMLKPIALDAVDTTVEFKHVDPKQRVLVFDSIKNAVAFQKRLSYPTDVWQCEVKDPVPAPYLLKNPSTENTASFWDKFMTGMAHGVYRNLPATMKLFIAPPGTVSVKSVRLIKRVE